MINIKENLYTMKSNLQKDRYLDCLSWATNVSHQFNKRFPRIPLIPAILIESLAEFYNYYSVFSQEI